MRRRFAIATLVLLLALSSVALAGSVAYELPWFTVDGGGGMWSTGGGFTLGGTVGQADAGVLTGGGYALSGGFWGPGGTYVGFLPVVMK